MNAIVSLMGDLIMPPSKLTKEEQQVLQSLETALENEIAPFVIQNDSIGRYPHKAITVSYTHLTLPTKRIV